MYRQFLIVIQDGNARRWYATTSGKDLDQAKARVMTKIQAHNMAAGKNRYLRSRAVPSVVCPMKVILAGDMEAVAQLTSVNIVTTAGLKAVADKLGAQPLKGAE